MWFKHCCELSKSSVFVFLKNILKNGKKWENQIKGEIRKLEKTEVGIYEHLNILAMFCYNLQPAQPEEDWPPHIAWFF
jgi:hypothetical protein